MRRQYETMAGLMAAFCKTISIILAVGLALILAGVAVAVVIGVHASGVTP